MTTVDDETYQLFDLSEEAVSIYIISITHYLILYIKKNFSAQNSKHVTISLSWQHLFVMFFVFGLFML